VTKEVLGLVVGACLQAIQREGVGGCVHRLKQAPYAPNQRNTRPAGPTPKRHAAPSGSALPSPVPGRTVTVFPF
jgi:hypothetical protein